MAYTPTGRPVGRPKTKDYQTISLKIPQALLDRVQRYARLHRQSISELIRDGLEWRITEGDLGWQPMHDNRYSSNTELHELAKPIHLVDDHIPFDEEPLPTAPAVARAQNNGNTVLQDMATPDAASAEPASAQAYGDAEESKNQQIRALRQQEPYRGMKYRALSEALYNMGIRTRKGTAINPGRLHHVLNETPVKKA